MISRQTPETIQAALARGTVLLAKSSDSPRLDAQLLLAHVLGKEPSWLVAHAESYLARMQAERFTGLLAKRAAGTPVAHAIGMWSFYGRSFEVNESVLVPRPETEHLVEAAVAYLGRRLEAHAFTKHLFTLLDVGVGSGAIACSIAAEFPTVVVDGTDVSEDAVKVAERNARRFNVHGRCKFIVGDLTQPVSHKQYDAVIANLPYVPSADVAALRGSDPDVALDGGPDGLDHYRRLLPALPPVLKPDCLVLLEAAPPTIRTLAELVHGALPDATVAIERDYGGRERYVAASRERAATR